jgi:hypothetical protein
MARHAFGADWLQQLPGEGGRAACADEQILRNDGSTIRRSWQRSATTDIG